MKNKTDYSDAIFLLGFLAFLLIMYGIEVYAQMHGVKP